jgi:dTDP-4-amino-4,6-dideoxygalactose transaminase
MLDLPGLHYTTSGRASILLALEVLGLGAGDAMLLPTYHCPTMVAPAVHLGVAPVVYPIGATGAPVLEWLESQDLSRVRAMLVAHFFGVPQPMHAIRQWCTDRGIALIEDCAHALFGRSEGRPVGTWGDMAIGSLVKFLPVSEGGCLVLNGGGQLAALHARGMVANFKSVLDIAETGAAHRRLPGLNNLISGSTSGLRALRGARPGARSMALDAGPATAAHLHPPSPDHGIDPRLAHAGLAGPCRWLGRRLPRQRIVNQRLENFERLRQGFQGCRVVHPLLAEELPVDCAPYVFPLWVDQPDPGYAELRRLGMPVYRWDRQWPGTPNLHGDFGGPWSHHVLQLACHQDLSPSQIERTVSTMLEVLAAV